MARAWVWAWAWVLMLYRSRPWSCRRTSSAFPRILASLYRRRFGRFVFRRPPGPRRFHIRLFRFLSWAVTFAVSPPPSTTKQHVQNTYLFIKLSINKKFNIYPDRKNTNIRGFFFSACRKTCISIWHTYTPIDLEFFGKKFFENSGKRYFEMYRRICRYGFPWNFHGMSGNIFREFLGFFRGIKNSVNICHGGFLRCFWHLRIRPTSHFYQNNITIKPKHGVFGKPPSLLPFLYTNV